MKINEWMSTMEVSDDTAVAALILTGCLPEFYISDLDKINHEAVMEKISDVLDVYSDEHKRKFFNRYILLEQNEKDIPFMKEAITNISFRQLQYQYVSSSTSSFELWMPEHLKNRDVHFASLEKFERDYWMENTITKHSDRDMDIITIGNYLRKQGIIDISLPRSKVPWMFLNDTIGSQRLKELIYDYDMYPKIKSMHNRVPDILYRYIFNELLSGYKSPFREKADRNISIFKSYYFDNTSTLKSLGKEHNITPSRVRSIVYDVLREMRRTCIYHKRIEEILIDGYSSRDKIVEYVCGGMDPITKGAVKHEIDMNTLLVMGVTPFTIENIRSLISNNEILRNMSEKGAIKYINEIKIAHDDREIFMNKLNEFNSISLDYCIGINRRIFAILKRSGINMISEIFNREVYEIMRLDGLGKVSFNELMKVLLPIYQRYGDVADISDSLREEFNSIAE